MPVNITGVSETLAAIRKFDPDLQRKMNKELKHAMVPIRDKARSYAASNSQMLSGWTSQVAFGPQSTKYRPFPKYDQAETQKGIVYSPGTNKRNRFGFSVTHYVANKSAGGAIYETAGRISGPSGQPTFKRTRFTPASYRETGKGFNKSLNPNAGRQFIAALGPLYGKSFNTNDQGRLIFRAWSEDQGKAARAVNLAIESAVNTFNATNTQSAYGLGA